MIVSSSYPFHRDDFHALFVHDLARGLVAAGAEVRVVTPATPEGETGIEEWQGVQVHRFGYPGLGLRPLQITGGDGIWERIKRAPTAVAAVPGLVVKMVLAVRGMLRAWKPDVVLTHWLVPGGLAAALAVRGVPVEERPRLIHLAHSSDVHLLAGLPGGGQVARLVARSGALAATSPFLARKLRTLVAPHEVAEVPLGVFAAIAPAAGVGSADESPRLCTMGRLLWNKGLERTLDVLEAIPGATLAIAGAGRDAECVAEEIASRQLSATLEGVVLGEAKSHFLVEHDAFVFLPDPVDESAFQDNLPVGVLEAMAHGIPVIATRVGALPELLDGTGAGLLVDPDPVKIAAEISNLSRDALAQMGQRAREVAAPFTVEACCSHLVALIDASDDKGVQCAPASTGRLSEASGQVG